MVNTSLHSQARDGLSGLCLSTLIPRRKIFPLGKREHLRFGMLHDSSFFQHGNCGIWCQTVLSKTHQRCTFSRFVSAVVKNSQTHQEVPWAGLSLFVAQAHQGISALAHSWKTPTRYWIDIQSEAFTFSQLSKPWRSSHRQHPDH